MNAAQRLDALERRLERYHAQLETAIEQRDRFTLKATWGVLKGIIIGGTFVGALLASGRWFPDLGWLGTVAITLVATLVAVLLAGLIGLWLERAEADESGKFWRLPRWQTE
jgi:hypothetical protein